MKKQVSRLLSCVLVLLGLIVIFIGTVSALPIASGTKPLEPVPPQESNLTTIKVGKTKLAESTGLAGQGGMQCGLDIK